MSQFSITFANAEQGDITVNPDGTLAYKIPAEFDGDTITFGIEGSIAINTYPADQAPVALPDTAHVAAGGTVEVDVLMNDSDPEGGVLEVTKATADVGNVTIIPGGRLSYTAPETGADTATITYSIADDAGNESTGAVSVDIVRLSVAEGEKEGEFVVSTAPGTLTLTVLEPAQDAGDYALNLLDLALGPVNLSPPRIVGDATAGSLLSVLPGLWAFEDQEEVLEISRQWLRGEVLIEGANDQDYVANLEDVGADLSVIETAKTRSGSHSARSTTVRIEPPDVVEAPWSPAAVSGLEVWLDASDASTRSLSGNEIVELADKSGAARHARRVVDVPAPTFGDELDGKGTLRFPNGGILKTDNGSLADLAGMPGLAILAVTQAHSGNAFCKCLALRGEQSGGGGYISAQTGHPMIWFGNGNRSWDGAASGPVISVVQYPQDGTHGDTRWWQDGTGLTPSSTARAGNSVMLPPDTYLQLGSENSPTSELAEILIISGSLDDGDRQKLEGYLAHKWGLAGRLPEDHPFKTIVPS